MAIVNMPQSNRIQLKVQTGLSGTGAPVYALRNFYNVKPAASDDSMYAVGVNLAGLQKDTLVAISTIATANLVEQ